MVSGCVGGGIGHHPGSPLVRLCAGVYPTYPLKGPFINEVTQEGLSVMSGSKGTFINDVTQRGLICDKLNKAWSIGA